MFKRNDKPKLEQHEPKGEHREVLFDAQQEPAFKDALRHMPEFSREAKGKPDDLVEHVKLAKGYTDILVKLDEIPGGEKPGKLGVNFGELREKLGELHKSLNDTMHNNGEGAVGPQETQNVKKEVRHFSPAERKVFEDIKTLKDIYKENTREIRSRYNSEEAWMESVKAVDIDLVVLVPETNPREEQELQALRQEHQHEVLPLLKRLSEREGDSSPAEQRLLDNIQYEKKEYKRKDEVLDNKIVQEKTEVLMQVDHTLSDKDAEDKIKGIKDNYTEKKQKLSREHQENLYNLLDDLYKLRRKSSKHGADESF